MRISDWSSDVCSSDLRPVLPGIVRRPISLLCRNETMMTDRTQTPTGFVIERRNWKFGRGTTARRWWHGGDAGRTAFYNALSSTFPVGEKFFMSAVRSEEHTSELQSLMRNSYAVFCLKKKH